MTMAHGAYRRPYDPANFITYAVAAFVTFVGLGFLLYFCFFLHLPIVVEIWMFAISVFIVFAVFVVGAIKFFLPPSSRVGEVTDKLLNCEKTIFTFAVAFAVIMPILLGTSPLVTDTDKVFGYVILAIIGCSTIADIVVSLLDIPERKLVELALFVVIGWACVVRLNRIIELSRDLCVYMFICGFAVYLIGTVIGSITTVKRRRLINSFTVAFGTALNFVGIFFYA